jgi:hypothetical protein
MQDYSYLDRKYFIDPTVYNCPYRNRNNVPYDIKTPHEFDRTDTKKCYVAPPPCRKTLRLLSAMAHVCPKFAV